MTTKKQGRKGSSKRAQGRRTDKTLTLDTQLAAKLATIFNGAGMEESHKQAINDSAGFAACRLDVTFYPRAFFESLFNAYHERGHELKKADRAQVEKHLRALIAVAAEYSDSITALEPRTPEERETERTQQDAEFFARLLEHPDTPKAFKEAFGAVYSSTFFERLSPDFGSPGGLRLFHPALMEYAQTESMSSRVATTMDTLLTLAETLIPDNLRESILVEIFPVWRR